MDIFSAANEIGLRVIYVYSDAVENVYPIFIAIFRIDYVIVSLFCN